MPKISDQDKLRQLMRESTSEPPLIPTSTKRKNKDRIQLLKDFKKLKQSAAIQKEEDDKVKEQELAEQKAEPAEEPKVRKSRIKEFRKFDPRGPTATIVQQCSKGKSEKHKFYSNLKKQRFEDMLERRAKKKEKEQAEAEAEALASGKKSTNSSTSKKNQNPDDENIFKNPQNLPETFFDNKQLEHQIKGTPKDLKDQKEEEWKKYQAELDHDEIEAEKQKDKEETEEQLRRDLDDTKYQIFLYNKTDQLQAKYEEKQRLLRQIRKLEHDKKTARIESIMAGNYSEGEEEEEELREKNKRKLALKSVSTNVEKEDESIDMVDEEVGDSDDEVGGSFEGQNWRDRGFMM